MKSIWKGSIAFGLVNIPIKLYSAVESTSTGFRLLHSKHRAPIQYKRVCSECQKEVPWEEVVKGLKAEDGEFYVLTKEEIEKIKPQKTNAIELVEFINSEKIDSIYFDAHYYAAPSKAGERPYFLLKEVLETTGRIAVGTFVMKEKEHVCVIMPYHEGILLTTLNYKYEVRDMTEIAELKDPPKIRKEELELAEKLTRQLYRTKFDIGKFKDNFMEELKKLVKKKEKGQIITIQPKGREVRKEKDLVGALKASLRKGA